ncbi:putative glycoside hydrolase, partial [Phialemonium atrogriseum]
MLRLALDLAQRLLPAFYTTTGMPYPRVNLRHGIPFYVNSPLHGLSGTPGGIEGPPEITETCSAGAGSLVLEFTVLSRLTGDPRFEQLAKRAFWAVWERKSRIGLIGAGVDAEDGHWIGAYSVIGAGADSFFEYALKTHILLSGHELPNRTWTRAGRNDNWLDPNSIYPPLSDDDNSPDSFLEAWHHAHAAIKRHLYNERDHPHYINVNLWTGSFASNWIDSLGAYYSGLLSLAGELDEAIETNLLYTAIWTKYSALPERWSLKDKTVEGGLGWWPLRPEFIESVYHLYRATKDPWYLYVGEMVLRDITRRCWTPCGWAGLQNVLDGEKSDRMESFFLGETAKYMYLLFDDAHPLNSLDAAYVFTTEGHPLLIPRQRPSKKKKPHRTSKTKEVNTFDSNDFTITCPIPPKLLPFTGSATAARPDIYHAARLLDLHLIPRFDPKLPAASAPGQRVARANHTFFPWTLPTDLLPSNGTCSKVYQPVEVTLEFASNSQPVAGGSAFNFMLSTQNMERLSANRIRVSSLSGLKVTMRQEEGGESEWRVTKVNGVSLGRDESVIMEKAIIGDVSDPRFNIVRDPVLVKLQHLHRFEVSRDTGRASGVRTDEGDDDEMRFHDHSNLLEAIEEANDSTSSRVADLGARVKSLLNRMAASLDMQLPAPATPLPGYSKDPLMYNLVINQTAVTPTGPGAAPLPDVDVPAAGIHVPAVGDVPAGLFPWATVFAAGDACGAPLPEDAARDHHVIVIRRGGCSFSAKLANIPAHPPSARSLQLVVVV